jgi:hypothetical protein
MREEPCHTRAFGSSLPRHDSADNVLIPGALAFVAADVGKVTPYWIRKPWSPFRSLLPIGLASVVLHGALLAFYLCHIVNNAPAPAAVRLLFALGLFIAPFLTMPMYLCIYVLPQAPPPWALNAAIYCAAGMHDRPPLEAGRPRTWHLADGDPAGGRHGTRSSGGAALRFQEFTLNASETPERER